MTFSWLIIQLSSFTIAYSQSNFRFQHFTTADGLAADGVFSIVQDSLGYIWFQHSDALTRYDGYSFKVYKFDPSRPASTKSGLHGELQLDYSGNVWIGPGKGGWFRYEKDFILTQYFRKTDSFINHKINLKDAIIQCFDFDEDGKTIWVGTLQQKGLFSLDLKTKQFRNFLNQTSGDPKCNSVFAVKDLGQFLLINTSAGIFLFDKKGKAFSRPTFIPTDTALAKNVSGIFTLDKGSEIILITATEFIRLSKEFLILERFPHLQEAIFDVASSDGIYWMSGYNNGLHQWNSKTKSLAHIRNDSSTSSLANNGVESLLVDRDGNVWVGSETKGVSKYAKQSFEFYNFSFPGINAATIFDTEKGSYAFVFKSKSIPYYIDPDNTLFAATIDEMKLNSTNFRPAKLKTYGFMNGFFKGKEFLWVSSSGVYGLPINSIFSSDKIAVGSIKRLMNETGNTYTLPDNVVTTALYEDVEGKLWVGTKGNGLYKIDPAIPYGNEGSVTNYLTIESDSNSISQNVVYGILPIKGKSFLVQCEVGVDLFNGNTFTHVFKDAGTVLSTLKGSDGTIYIGTPHGLYTSNKEDFQFEFDPILDGIDIYGMCEDDVGRLWIENGKGILCYDRRNQNLIQFDHNDGIVNVRPPYNIVGITKAANGVMLTFGPDGISLFNPHLLKLSIASTNPVITKLEVNNQLPPIGSLSDSVFTIGQHISTLQKLVIDHQHNNFSFEFASMEMIAPEKNLYQHKLEGYDQEWIQSDWKNRRASYTNLPAGDYTFRVKASNHHGIWSDQEKTLKVIILPPPWKTWWAYTGYGLLFLGALYAARGNIVQRERLKASLKLEQVEHEKEHFELEKAKEVDRVKTSFFTNISHEFRTPLTLIKGPVQNLLEEFNDNPKVIEHLKLVQRNSDLLLKLINQLLDLARLESGSLKEEKTEGELNSFINAITSSFSSLAHQKNVQLNVKVPAEHYLALFDKDKLETILINLINNAIKFTPAHGSVTVIAELIPDAQWLSLKVRDTGIGIPENQQSKIFERFHQVSEAHKEVGTGIGLALVKELVALMKGTISVCSEIGKGSEFHVKLPIEIFQKDVIIQNEERLFNSTLPTMVNEQRITSINDEKEEAIAKPHILVVEDNADLRAFIIDSLGNEFYFFEAKHGKQGLDIATQEVPDLIISDVMMPEMDGITMTGLIKKDIRSSHIPLILLTAKSTEDSKLSGLQHGADDYLTKPFNKYELQLKVHNGIMSRARLREKVRMELLMESSIVKVQSADEQFLMTVKQAIQRRLGDETLSVESLAEEIGMSRVQLYRKVVALTGLSVNELIRSFRLQKASHLLQQKWGSVSQVAYEVGFSNLSYFSKCFRDEYGVLPSEFSMPSN